MQHPNSELGRLSRAEEKRRACALGAQELKPPQSPVTAPSRCWGISRPVTQPPPLPHTQGPLDKDPTEWEGPAGRPSGSGRRILRGPEPANPGSHSPSPQTPQSPPLANTTHSAPDPAVKRVHGGDRAAIPSLVAPFLRENDPGLPRTRSGLSGPCPPTPAYLNPPAPQPPPSRTSHSPAPADKAPDIGPQSPPLDPRPAPALPRLPPPRPATRTSASRPGPR